MDVIVTRSADRNSRRRASRRKNRTDISYKDALKFFIKPTAQESLGGDLGVDLSEIAQALQVDFHDLKKNLERSDFFEMAKVLKLKMTSIDRFNDNGVLTRAKYCCEQPRPT